MSIISKIKASVESATGYTLHYYDEGTINEVLDANPLPCAFYYLLKDTELLVDGEQNRERANVAVFFVNKTEFDFNSADNETIIEAVKTKGNIWLRSLMADSAIKISENTQLKTTRLYNQFDQILTGIGFNITLEEVYGFNACTDAEYTPTHKLIITQNGLFDVHNYYWVEVAIPTETKSLSVTENGDYQVTPTPNHLMTQVNVSVNVPTDVNWGEIGGALSEQTDLQGALDGKVDKVSTASKVYGTDAQGNQTTYDKDSLGAPIDDSTTSTTKVWSSSKVSSELSGKEMTANKVTSLSASSTDTQYPSAKCVYDIVGDIETLLASI